MNKLPRDLQKKLQTDSITVDMKFKKNLKKTLFEGESMKNKKIGIKSMLAGLKASPLVLATMAVVFVGTTSAVISNKKTNQARQQEIELPQDLGSVLGVDKIREIALQNTSTDTSISGIELEEEEGVLVYKVHFSDGSLRIFDAKTGSAVVKQANVETNASAPTDFATQITPQQAREIAQKQRSGKTITKIELETEEGVVVYSVRFSDGGRADVNATTGEVVRVKNAETKDGATSTSRSSETSSSSTTSSDDSSDDSSQSSEVEDESHSGSDDDKNKVEDEKKDDNSGSGSNSGSGNRN